MTLLLLSGGPVGGGAIATAVAPHGSEPSGSGSDHATVAIAAATSSLTKAWGFAPTFVPPTDCGGTGAGCVGSALSGMGVANVPVSASSYSPFFPPPLIGASLTYDAASTDEYVLLFGGELPSHAASGQTWAFVQGRWTNLTGFIRHGSPSGRYDAMMAYDPAQGYVLLYGGCAAPGNYGMCFQVANETWKWVDGVWSLLIPPGPPPSPPGGPPPPPVPPQPSGRWDSAMTWDSSVTTSAGTGAIVLFGGAGPIPLTAPGIQVTQPVFHDTWLWQGSGNWVNITSRSTSTPPSLYGARIATDPITATTILFGGTNLSRFDSVASNPPVYAAAVGWEQAVVSNWTWQFQSNDQWTNLSGSFLSAPPPPRWDASMGVFNQAILSQGDAIVVLGGTNASGVVLNDIWSFQSTTQGWIQLSASPNPPQPSLSYPVPRYDAAFTFDTFDGFFLEIGGSDVGGTPLGDGFLFIPPSTWGIIDQEPPSVPTTPSDRYSSAFAFDDQARSAVLYGGESCSATACRFLSDTWSYSNGAWTQLATAQAPAARFGASVSFDPTTGQVVLFGGCGAVCPMGDTWVFTTSAQGTPSWTELFSAISPPARYFASLVYDPPRNDLILFGGCEGALGPCPAGDTWIYSGAGNWRQFVEPLGFASPAARFGASTTFDPGPVGALPTVASGFMLLYGGEGAHGPLSDTWTFGTVQSTAAPRLAPAALGWTEVSTPISPPGRLFASLVYDPAAHEVVLLGGCQSGSCPALSPWIFQLSNAPPLPGQIPDPFVANPWIPMPNGSIDVQNDTVASLYGMSVVYDPAAGSAGYIFAVGGRTVTAETVADSFGWSGGSFFDLTPYD